MALSDAGLHTAAMRVALRRWALVLLVSPACQSGSGDEKDSTPSSDGVGDSTQSSGDSMQSSSEIDASGTTAQTEDSSTATAESSADEIDTNDSSSELETTSTTTITSSTTDSGGTSTSSDAESAMAAVQEIFDNSCGCHLVGDGAGGLLLRQDVSWDRLVGQKSSADAMLVVAGEPDASYLLHKILGTQGQVAGGNGDQMPKGRPLSASDIDVIEAWIADGALP